MPAKNSFTFSKDLSRVEVGLDEHHVLHVGDTLLYTSTIPHRWFNRTAAVARFLIVSSPPSF